MMRDQRPLREIAELLENGAAKLSCGHIVAPHSERHGQPRRRRCGKCPADLERETKRRAAARAAEAR